MILFLLQVFLAIQPTDPPPNMVRCGNYYVDKTEVSNLNWLEFEFSIKGFENQAVPYILPDSSNTWWRKQEFRHYPIVLISREQAITYCMWRSKMVSRKLGYEVNFRLPTPEEWSIIASHLIKNNARLINSAFKKNRKKLSGKNQKYFLFESSPGQEYPKESIKSIVHYFDNVSEMTSTPNIAMGGNNQQMIIPNTTRSHEIKHLEPGRFIGFRCIVEIDESNH